MAGRWPINSLTPASGPATILEPTGETWEPSTPTGPLTSISGAVLRRSLLFTGVQINSFASVENAVVLPYVNVGRHARLKNVVIDRGVRIPEGLVVGEDPELDAERFRTTPQGIALITQPMIDGLNA